MLLKKSGPDFYGASRSAIVDDSSLIASSDVDNVISFEILTGAEAASRN
jgi:hypothetical protein